MVFIVGLRFLHYGHVQRERNISGIYNTNFSTFQRSFVTLTSKREALAQLMRTELNAGTYEWGIRIERIEIKNIQIPQALTRAMAAKAEAQRESEAKMVSAEGEAKAAVALKAASDIMQTSPGALQLRYLETLNTISSTQKSSIIIFPIPMDLFPFRSVQPPTHRS